MDPIIFTTPYGDVSLTLTGKGEQKYRDRPALQEAVISFEDLTVNRINVRGWVNYSLDTMGWRLTSTYIRRVGSYQDDLSWNLREKVQTALLAGLNKYATPSKLNAAEVDGLMRSAYRLDDRAAELRKQADELVRQASEMRHAARALASNG